MHHRGRVTDGEDIGIRIGIGKETGTKIGGGVNIRTESRAVIEMEKLAIIDGENDGIETMMTTESGGRVDTGMIATEIEIEAVTAAMTGAVMEGGVNVLGPTSHDRKGRDETMTGVGVGVGVKVQVGVGPRDVVGSSYAYHLLRMHHQANKR